MYFLWAHDDYYPSGGIGDLQDRSTDIEELKRKAEKIQHDEVYITCDQLIIIWRKS